MAEPEVQETPQGQSRDGNSEDIKVDLSVFGLPEDHGLPPEALQLMEQYRKTWQKNWTEKRMREAEQVKQAIAERDQWKSKAETYAEKAKTLDALYQDKSFTEWATQRSQGDRGIASSTLDYNQFEDGESLKAFTDDLVTRVTNSLAEIISPVIGQLSETAKSSKMATLKQIAKEKGWEDPEILKEAIDFNMRQYNMTLEDAYHLARAKTLETRPAVNLGAFGNEPTLQGGAEETGNTSQASTAEQPDDKLVPVLGAPGSGNLQSSAVVSRSALDEALKLSESDKKPTFPSVSEVVKDIVNNMRKRGEKVDTTPLFPSTEG